MRGSLAVRYLRIAGRIDGVSTKSLVGETVALQYLTDIQST